MRKFTPFKSCHCIVCRHFVRYKAGTRKEIKQYTHQLWRTKQKRLLRRYLVSDGAVDWEFGWLSCPPWA